MARSRAQRSRDRRMKNTRRSRHNMRTTAKQDSRDKGYNERRT